MTDIRKWAFVGLMGLGLVSIGCASNNDNSGTGGSSSSSGGSNGAQGGSTGSGGSSSTGSGGSSSAGSGGSAAVGCQASDAPPSSGTIADFQVDGGLEIMGGPFTYPDPFPGNTAATPGASLDSAGFHISWPTGANAGANPAYVGAGLYFNGNAAGTDCVDASSYTGVQFDMSGSFSGCTLNYSTNDSEHSAVSATDSKPSCTATSCYSPQLALASADLPKTYMIPFTGTGAPSGGGPSTPIDPMKLTGLGWNFTVPAAGTCVIDLTIKNIKFYK